MTQSVAEMDARDGGSPVPVAHPRDPLDAIKEIEFHLDSLGYTDKEWSHTFYSGLMRTIKRIREIVKEIET